MDHVLSTALMMESASSLLATSKEFEPGFDSSEELEELSEHLLVHLVEMIQTSTQLIDQPQLPQLQGQPQLQPQKSPPLTQPSRNSTHSTSIKDKALLEALIRAERSRSAFKRASRTSGIIPYELTPFRRSP